MAQKSLPPYSPRWFSRTFEILTTPPALAWTLCILTIILVPSIHHLVAWQQADLPRGQLSVYFIGLPFLILVYPIMWQGFSVRAQPAIQEFYLGRRASSASVQRETKDFLSIPPVVTPLAIFLGGLVGWVTYYQVVIYAQPLTAQVLPWFSLIATIWGNAWAGAFILRAVKQITALRRMLAKTDADIFNPGPVYALSDYSAATAATSLLVIYGPILITLPSYLFSPLGFAVQAIIIFLSLVLFFTPLAQIANRRRRSKQTVLYQLTDSLRTLHSQLIASGRASRIQADILRARMGALKEELEIVQRMSPWPWQSDTLRNVLTPVLIPIFVYLVQRFFGNMLGF